ncbi:hypothetical protein [Gordonia caeni]|uniref:Integral membrane protein n=1 Tax=Gordonia caeni TaxID=1007097 RepID=A0ABP7PRM9_9ACTN
MRSLLTVLFVLLAAAAMIVAVPTMWSTVHVVSADGFADAASRAAEKPEVQEFFAAQIADEVAQSTDLPIAGAAVAPLATSYTQSPAFVTDFTEIARQQHEWLFTEPAPGTSPHEMDLDITPMVNQVLSQSPVPVRIDHALTIEVDQSRLTAGSMVETGRQVTLIGWLSLLVAAIAALIALVLGRNRSAVVAWLGLGAILAGVVSVLASQYLQSRAADSVSGSDLSTQQTVKVVAGDVLHGLTVTSWVVAAVGLAVTLIAAVAMLVVGRR